MAIKEFIKELITRVNKEINAQEYPKVISEINNTSVSILIKEIQIIVTDLIFYYLFPS